MRPRDHSATAALVVSALLSLASPAAPARAQEPIAPRAVPEAEAIRAYDLRTRLDTYGPGDRQAAPGAVVEVIDGDLHVSGDLLADWRTSRERVERIAPRRPGDRPATTLPNAVGLVVTGRLSVDGAIINAGLNGGPWLLVLGETRARSMFAGGGELHFEKLATFTDAVVGCYNDGQVTFAGGAQAPLVISEDHSFRIVGTPEPKVVDYFNDSDDLDLLKARLHPDVGAPGDITELEAEALLLPRIRRGLPILRDGQPDSPGARR